MDSNLIFYFFDRIHRIFRIFGSILFPGEKEIGTIESFKTFCRNIRQKNFDCFIIDFLTNIFNFFTVIEIVKIAKLLSKQLCIEAVAKNFSGFG